MPDQDLLKRFLFEQHGVRGVWVRLQQSWQQAKQFQPITHAAIDRRLGQALAAAAMLSATIKFDGALIMQIQGDGILKALVAQATSQRTLRGLVRSDAEAALTADSSLKALLGDHARMVLTVESAGGEPYQGIVAIAAEELAGVLQDYFQQSEQLPTRLWLFADAERAAGLMIQQLPGSESEQTAWEHIQILSDTVTAEEMLNLDCEELLHRLFHQEQVRVFDAEALRFQCACSEQKIADTLILLGENEVNALFAQQTEIEVDCQFCGAQYRFTQALLAAIQAKASDHQTLH
jgi:molecular chaperone Hsp33